MIGQTISHYRILEKLGEGGMGVVYRALDIELDREVALKFLPSHIKGTEEEQARFIQEARSASALNHPHVCSIHSIGTHEGQKFIDMELVDGMTLRSKIEKGRLSVDSAIRYAIQIGEALQEAHANGIIHRDVKTENIMVNHRDQVKVMDFGLAKLKGSLRLTKTSSTVGTLSYMAPEQIQGTEADARSDIFSFGVVVYELLTGKMPFRGEHEASMVYSIVHEEPEPLERHCPEAPPELLHVVVKALDKDPDDRYQSVGEMVVDLRRAKRDSTKISGAAHKGASSSPGVPIQRAQAGWRNRIMLLTGALVLVAVSLLYILPWGVETGKGPKKIVVIPFENLGESEKEYFADGITDEITSRLSHLSGLGVIARSSARGYKGSTKSPAQIGDELGVDYILMGTIRWSEDGRIRINSELVDVSTSLQTWAQPYEADFSDAFTLQAQVASRVAEALDLELVQGEREKLSQNLTSNPRAYDFYLKGIEYDNRGFERDHYESAMLMYERAIAEDPGFAAAYAKLSRAHSGFYWFHHDRSPERVEMARVAAEKAISLDPHLSDAYSAMGWHLYHGKLDYDGALEQFDLALKYWPNNPDVFYGIGAVRRRQGDMEGAIEALRKSVAADPRDVEKVRQIGETLGLVRKYEEAAKYIDQALALAPDGYYALWNKAQNILLWTGNTDDARSAVEESMKGGMQTHFVILAAEVLIEWYARDSAAAMEAVRRFGGSVDAQDNQFVYRPVSLLEARIQQTIGDPEKAEMLFEEARKLIEHRIAEYPEDSRLHSSLGIALAGLDRRDEAVSEAEKGVELLTIEMEAWRGSYRLLDLATVYTMVGEKGNAIALLEQLLAIPCEVSVQLLRIDPTWDSLRDEPQFKALIGEPS